MSNLTTAWPTTDDEGQAVERNSDVDGFTVVRRNGRSPKIHELRPWNECNSTRSKSGSNTFRVMGSREVLGEALARIKAKRGESCRRCFPYDADEDVENLVIEYEGAPAEA